MFGRATAIAVLLATSGCSYLLIDRPPRAVRKADSMPACTFEKTWPLVDVAVGIFGVAGGLAIATGLLQADNSDGTMRELTSGEKLFFAPLSIAEGLLFVWSAYHGHETTNACRDLRAKMPPPPQYPYPYPYPQQPYPQQPYPQQPYPQGQPYPQPAPAPQAATP